MFICISGVLCYTKLPRKDFKFRTLRKALCNAPKKGADEMFSMLGVGSVPAEIANCTLPLLINRKR